MKTTTNYKNQLHIILSPGERRIFAKLTMPQKIQNYLDSLPVNSEEDGEMLIFSPREVLRRKKAHCIEAALLAATVLAYHGESPLLMDIQSVHFDLDHVVTLFTQNGLWGAISKTNHNVLRWRDPVYRSPRELAMSYFHEYFWPDKGKRYRTKTMRAFSKPFDLRRYKPEQWVTTGEDLDWLAQALDDSPHLPAYPKSSQKFLRPTSKLEVMAMHLMEWPEKKKH